MASVNKIIYGGNVLLDLTGDTVTPQTLAQGATAHNAAGEQIVGTNLGASGDMKKSDYDPDSNISNVGGIEAYFTDAVYSDPAETTPESILSTTEEVLRKVYPVGAVYMSVNSADPADLFGFGTWERVKDRFLLAAGDAYAAGSTGGEATHTLTINEMPKHGHKVFTWTGASDNSGQYAATMINEDTNEFYTVSNGAKVAHAWQDNSFKTWGGSLHDGAGDPTGSTGFSGHSSAHNNMPPYLAVYIWKRTA